MTADPYRIKRIVSKLETFWAANPNATFGQMVETIENIAWDGFCSERTFSARLANLPDEWFEAALNHTIKKNGLDSGWKS